MIHRILNCKIKLKINWKINFLKINLLMNIKIKIVVKMKMKILFKKKILSKKKIQISMLMILHKIMIIFMNKKNANNLSKQKMKFINKKLTFINNLKYNLLFYKLKLRSRISINKIVNNLRLINQMMK